MSFMFGTYHLLAATLANSHYRILVCSKDHLELIVEIEVAIFELKSKVMRGLMHIEDRTITFANLKQEFL